jgi:hypothetical protein
MNIKINGFYYYKNVPEKDLRVIDRKGNLKPYKRNFWEKLGDLIKYGETLESFSIIVFKKEIDGYLATSLCEAGSITTLNKRIRETRHSSFKPVRLISEDTLEFIEFEKKRIVEILDNSDKIKAMFPNGNSQIMYFTQFTNE